MEISFNIQTKEGDEYIIAVTDADISPLSEDIKQMLLEYHLQIGEIIIDRKKGDHCTGRKVLHKIANELANIFAENQDLILYYFCDDTNPIPNRNIKGQNKDLSSQEYRSRLFSKLFEGYKKSHQVTGINDYPIIIDGEGYKEFVHLIARSSHKEFVLAVRNDIKIGWGKERKT